MKNQPIYLTTQDKGGKGKQIRQSQGYHNGAQGAQWNPGTTMGPLVGPETTRGLGETLGAWNQKGARVSKWGPGTTMGPRDHNGTQGPQWGSGLPWDQGKTQRAKGTLLICF